MLRAVVGFLHRDGRPAERETLYRMASAVAHRGPDVADWCHGPVALGACSFPLANGATPWSGHPANGDVVEPVVVADSRIDNREELAAQLLLERPVDAISGTELILAGYRAWGSSIARRLIGDFAFAIWDPRRKTLLCARDVAGVKPLYYHLSDRLFAFASEIKGLFGLPGIPRELDQVQVAHFLDSYSDDPERTFYQGVRRLPAAHLIEILPHRVRIEQYWSADPSHEVRYSTNDQYAEAFREIFLEAVRVRLRGAAVVGASLSGGLDSSSIVVTTRRVLPTAEPLHAFSAVFPGLPDAERRWNDESDYIDAVVRTGHILSHRIAVDAVPPLVEWDRAFRYLDSPRLGFNRQLNWSLYGAAREQGVDVYLDGAGGDDVVGMGFMRFDDLAREGRWKELVEEVHGLTRRWDTTASWFPRHLIFPEMIRLARSGRWVSWFRASRAVGSGLGRSQRGLFLRYGVGAMLPQSALESRRRMRAEIEPGRLIEESFARRIGLRDLRRSARRTGEGRRLSGREAHARDLSTARSQTMLELVGGVAAAFGIEARFPFLDRRLMEFCVAVPMEQKLDDGWTRLILRRAMEGLLPPAVQWRVRKGDLAFSFVRGMHDFERSRVYDVLFDGSSPLEEFVDMEALRSTYDHFFASAPSVEGNADAMKLYNAALLARWLREHGPGVSK